MCRGEAAHPNWRSSTTARPTIPTTPICSPVRSVAVASSASGWRRCCPRRARPVAAGGRPGRMLPPIGRTRAAMARMPSRRWPRSRRRTSTMATPRQTACGIRSGTRRASATGRPGARCGKSSPPFNKPLLGRSTTPSGCGGRCLGSGWGCTVGTGSRRATTSTSTPRSRRASRCGPDRRPTRRCTWTACDAAGTCRCCCCSTCRVRRPSAERSGARCTNNSVRWSPASVLPCTTWVTGWRCMPTTRRGAGP